MCLAEQIVYDILILLGYREPKEHSKWKWLVEMLQAHIDSNIERMKRVADSEASLEWRRFQRKSKLGKIIECLKS